MFTGISVLAALLGFGLAWQLYYRRPELPGRIAASMAGEYQILLAQVLRGRVVRSAFRQAADRWFDANPCGTK